MPDSTWLFISLLSLFPIKQGEWYLLYKAVVSIKLDNIFERSYYTIIQLLAYKWFFLTVGWNQTFYISIIFNSVWN